MNRTNEEKILDMLAGMQLNMQALKNDVLKINIRQETDFTVKLDALSEGHAAILEQLVPTTRVDELENRVKMLEAVLSSVTSELRELKKAQ